jgi:hypothetical protein
MGLRFIAHAELVNEYPCYEVVGLSEPLEQYGTDFFTTVAGTE